MEPSKQYDWSELTKEIKFRLSISRRQPAYIFYFIALPIFVGGLGVWLPSAVNKTASFNLTGLVNGICTYYLATFAGASAEIFLSTHKKPLVMLALLLLLIATVSAAVFIVRSDESWTVWSSVIMSLISLWWWWLANAGDDRWTDTVDPQIMVGGDTSQGLSGSIAQAGLQA